jgi:hypothetical protein
MQNLDLLGYNTGNERNASGCAIWHYQHYHQQQEQQQPQQKKTTQQKQQHKKLVRLSNDLNTFRSELAHYTQVVRDFAGVDGDLRMRLTDNDPVKNHEVCKVVDLHPQGLKGLFPSGQLSLTSSSGFVEPLFPPMRHAEFCFQNQETGDSNNNANSSTSSSSSSSSNNSLYPNYEHLMNPEYLIHDFGAMCRKLKRTSRIVLIDMGASLDFHESMESPVMYLIELFYKFGLHFDHVYAHEINFASPQDVYSRIPLHLLPVYHWINVGVSATPGDRFNPFTQLLLQYNEDDLIIVKLDIDTPSLEMSLAQQLLSNPPPPPLPAETKEIDGEANTTTNKNSSTVVVDDSGPRLRRLIDQFYFEHHVHLSELAELWGEETMQGSVKDTMELFYSLRNHGIPAHFWV